MVGADKGEKGPSTANAHFVSEDGATLWREEKTQLGTLTTVPLRSGFEFQVRVSTIFCLYYFCSV